MRQLFSLSPIFSISRSKPLQPLCLDMPIKYSCVNEGATMLGEHPVGEQPKLATTLQRVLSTVPAKEYRRKTVEDKENNLNYFYISNGEGRIVGCVASSDVRMRTAFAYLEAVEPLVRSLPADAAKDGKPDGGKQFRKIIQQKMDFYNDPRNDKITALNNDINEVVDVMMDNMDKVLARGDRVDNLHAKTVTLSEQANVFSKKSADLKRQMCLRNAKLTAMVVGGVLVVILIILMIACKPNFSDCS